MTLIVGEIVEGSMCYLCGGLLIYLGKLGNMNHFKCRNCGLQDSEIVQEDVIIIDKNSIRKDNSNANKL